MAITQTIATLPAVLNDSATFYEDIAERNNSLVTTVLPSINVWAAQANTTQEEINAKALQVASQAVDGGYSQDYINSNFVGARITTITVNVGAGQTYTTINQALEYLSRFCPIYKKSGVTATIILKSGFVMAEQVLVSGIDLGWVTIVGEDAETIITHTALTIDFNGAHYPAFGVSRGGTSPAIGQLFRFNVEKVGGNKHGLMAYNAGSSAYVLPAKGFIGAGASGIYAYASSTINAEGANCSNAGSYGIYAASSTINAEGANCSNAGSYGIYAASSTINAEGANCSNAGSYGIYAASASTINAKGAIIQNQTTGYTRVNVFDGSHILANGIDTAGGTDPVFNQAINTLTRNGIIYQ